MNAQMLFWYFKISNGGKALRYIIHAVCSNDLKTQEKKDENRNSVWPKRALHEPTAALGWFCCNTGQPFPPATHPQNLTCFFKAYPLLLREIIKGHPMAKRVI